MRVIDKEILRLAIPSIISNITVPLLGLVDLAIAGHLGDGTDGSGEAYIAAISVGSMIFNIIYWLMGFLRMGTSGMTSQAVGAKDWQGVLLLLRRSLTVSLVIAAAFLVLQVPLGWGALQVIHPSERVMPLARTYFNIVIWGAPAMLSLYSLNGWFIGMQTTRVPMMVAIFQNVVNIIASLTLVVGLGWKVEGVATGTLVAQWSGVLLALWFMRKMVRRTKVASANGEVDAVNGITQNPPQYSWGAFFNVNRDIFLRTVCLVSVNLAFTSVGARQGDMMLAVNTLLMTFYTLFSYVMDGFAFAGEALAGKYYGAKDEMGLKEVIHSLLRHWGLPLAIAFTIAYSLGGSLLVQLLTDDMGVVAAAGRYLPWAWVVPLAGYAAFVYDGIFIGLTATRGMLVSSFVAALAFFCIDIITMLTPLPHTQPLIANHILWLSFIVYLAMRGVMQNLWLRHSKHKSNKKDIVT